MTNNVATTIFVISASMVIAMIGTATIPQNASALIADAELRLPQIITAPFDLLLDRKDEKSPPASTPANANASSANKTRDESGDSDNTPVSYQGAQISTEPFITLQSLQPRLDQSRLNNHEVIANPSQEVKGASTVASPASILQATNSGWEIFGIPWYQWVIGAGAIALGLWWGQKVLGPRFSKRASLE